MDAEHWDERYAATELVWSKGPNQFVDAELAGLSPGRAVDLAGGEGRNGIWLAGRGWQITVVDFSQVGLDKGRRLAEATEEGSRIEWVRADVTTWSPDEPVGLVVVAYLQVPPDERRTAARNAVRMLRPGGTLLWVAHDSTNLDQGTGGPQDPAVLMTAEDVVADVEDLGVEVERADRVERVVPVADEHGGEEDRTAYDCLVRLRRR